MRTLDEDVVVQRAAEDAAKREMAIYQFLESHPSLNFEANRGLIREYLGQHPATMENLTRAVESLGLSLAAKPSGQIAAEAADEIDRQQQAAAEERESLIEIIVQDYSRDSRSQEHERSRLVSRGTSLEVLRDKVRTIHDRKRFRAMAPDELKQWLRQQREQGKRT